VKKDRAQTVGSNRRRSAAAVARQRQSPDVTQSTVSLAAGHPAKSPIHKKRADAAPQLRSGLLAALKSQLSGLDSRLCSRFV
jgi:hypothetical protein